MNDGFRVPDGCYRPVGDCAISITPTGFHIIPNHSERK